MERWRGRVAVVTGASSGIGAAIAYQLQDAGLTVVGFARRAEQIRSAVEGARKAAEQRGKVSLGKAPTPGKLHARQCDLQREEDIIAAFRWVKDNVGGLHVLVNNAAVAGSVTLTESNSEEWRNILNTNVLGLSLCTREAIKLMREKGIDDGHIVHIGSKAGHYTLALPGTEMYAAAKHGVRVLTEGLRKELVAAKSKIRITEVSPGAVRTEIFEKVPMRKEILAAIGVDKTSDLWAILPHLQSEEVADAVLYVISTPPHVQIHEVIMGAVGEQA